MKTPLILEATYLNLSGAAQHFVVRAYGVDEKGCPMIIDAYVPLVSALDSGRTRKALLGMAKVDKLQLVNGDYFRVEIRVGDDIACPGCGTLVCSCEQRSGGADLAVDEFPNSFSSPRAYVPTECDPGPPTPDSRTDTFYPRRTPGPGHPGAATSHRIGDPWMCTGCSTVRTDTSSWCSRCELYTYASGPKG